jgi:hypothetical protein
VHINHWRQRALWLLLISATVSGRLDAASDPTSAVLGCAGLRDDSERLACYDRLAARLSASTGLAPAPAAAAAGEVFGLRSNSPAKPPAENPAERKALSSITARVVSLRELPEGRSLIGLDNGQTWEQTSGGDLALKVGDAVKISRAALGSFLLVTHGRGERVRRVH